MNKYSSNIFKNKKYAHFDVKKNPEDYESRISNRDWVSTHGFFPFIHYEMQFNKYVRKVGFDKYTKEKKTKTRHIYYSSHIDRYIYQYYSNELNNCYNDIVLKNNINNSSIAYRNNLRGKCNIHFAKEVIDFISKQENAFIYIADFTSFFDRLNHSYLKDKLCEVLNTKWLPKEHFAIYKNITNFSYVEKEDILKYKNIGKKKFEDLNVIFDTTEEFKKFKKLYLKKHKDSENGKKNIGIPQGSSISAVYSNIYMIDFDKQVNEYVERNNGIYRRYCDDIIVVIPINEGDCSYNEHIEIINDIQLSVPDLIISEEKTSKFLYTNGTIKGIDRTSKNTIDYLGFSYDGKSVKIREKSLFKYYSRMYKKVRIVKKRSELFKRKANRRRLYKLYSHLGAHPSNGHGNFLTYAYKSYEIIGEENEYKNMIRRQVRNHWKSMYKRINSE